VAEITADPSVEVVPESSLTAAHRAIPRSRGSRAEYLGSSIARDGDVKAALILAVTALVSTPTAMSERAPTRLAKDDTVSETAVAAASTNVTLDLNRHPLPQPYTAFGFRAITTYTQQPITLKWSLSCYRGKTRVAQSGVVRGHRLVIVWKAPTIRPADYCYLDVIAQRPYGSGGRLIATIVGRR
jgi:hypothetical protein